MGEDEMRREIFELAFGCGFLDGIACATRIHEDLEYMDWKGDLVRLSEEAKKKVFGD